jgi:hypothetical protein
LRLSSVLTSALLVYDDIDADDCNVLLSASLQHLLCCIIHY